MLNVSFKTENIISIKCSLRFTQFLQLCIHKYLFEISDVFLWMTKMKSLFNACKLTKCIKILNIMFVGFRHFGIFPDDYDKYQPPWTKGIADTFIKVL